MKRYLLAVAKFLGYAPGALNNRQLAGVACAECGAELTDQAAGRVEGTRGLRSLYVCNPHCPAEATQGEVR